MIYISFYNVEDHKYEFINSIMKIENICTNITYKCTNCETIYWAAVFKYILKDLLDILINLLDKQNVY